MFKSKKFWYIGLFVILFGVVAFSSFFHAISFFGLANNTWMSIILAMAFEIGQAAVLFSLLTSKKDRTRIMPWVLMTIFTSVQVVGNVFSSYKYLMINSVENLKYFKEPIFIWTDLPDNEATVIVTWCIGAILPICSLLLTSMITNYLNDIEEEKSSNKIEEKQPKVTVQEDINVLPEKIPEQGPSAPVEFKDDKEFIDIYNNGSNDDKENDKINVDEAEDGNKEDKKLNTSHFVNL